METGEDQIMLMLNQARRAKVPIQRGCKGIRIAVKYP